MLSLRTTGTFVFPYFMSKPLSLLNFLPVLNPKFPMVSDFAFWLKIETENALYFFINSLVKLFLLQLTANFGGSDVI